MKRIRNLRFLVPALLAVFLVGAVVISEGTRTRHHSEQERPKVDEDTSTTSTVRQQAQRDHDHPPSTLICLILMESTYFSNIFGTYDQEDYLCIPQNTGRNNTSEFFVLSHEWVEHYPQVFDEHAQAISQGNLHAVIYGATYDEALPNQIGWQEHAGIVVYGDGRQTRKRKLTTTDYYSRSLTKQHTRALLCDFSRKSTQEENIFGSMASKLVYTCTEEHHSGGRRYKLANEWIQHNPEIFLQVDSGFQAVLYGATLTSDQSTVLWSANSGIVVIHEGKEDTDNRLLSSTQKTATAQPSIGVRQVTMVRISTSDATPKPTGEELQEILFGTSRKLLSVQAQIQACSAGQLILEPSPSLGGVVEVQLDQSLDHFGNDASRLIARASQQVGIHEIQESLDHYLDHILYCLPPGTGNWVASAVTNHYRSSYNNEHCAHLSVILHELGHNFGLGHSNLPSQNGLYRDRTGYMGSSDATIGKPAKCYNAYQHFQLSWFAEATITITDEGMDAEEAQLVTLAPFVEFDANNESPAVVINVMDKLFLQYNRAKYHNAGTVKQYRNQIIVVENDGRSSATNLVAALDAHRNTVYQDDTVRIEVCSMDYSPTEDRVTLSIGSVSSDSACGRRNEKAETEAEDVFEDIQGRSSSEAEDLHQTEQQQLDEDLVELQKERTSWLEQENQQGSNHLEDKGDALSNNEGHSDSSFVIDLSFLHQKNGDSGDLHRDGENDPPQEHQASRPVKVEGKPTTQEDSSSDGLQVKAGISAVPTNPLAKYSFLRTRHKEQGEGRR